MAKSRLHKKDELKAVTDGISASKSLVFINFDGLTVKEVEQLRSKCREQNVGYVVAKKTLLRLALKKANIDIDPKKFAKSIATVIGFEDEIAPARVIEEFAKTHPNLISIAGFMEGRVISHEEIVSLSKLPSKLQLLSNFVGSLQSPIRGFAQVLAGNIRGLVQVLNAIKESK